MSNRDVGKHTLEEDQMVADNVARLDNFVTKKEKTSEHVLVLIRSTSTTHAMKATAGRISKHQD